MKTRQCYICKQTKQLKYFKRDASQKGGYHYRCKKCSNRTRNISRRDPHEKMKQRTYMAVWYAVKTGKLHRPKSCPKCSGRYEIQGHHADYSQPLSVEWMCRPCHEAHHARLKRIEYLRP